MKNETLINQLNQIVLTDNSWKKNIVSYEENKDWLEVSADIAIRILNTLRAKKTNGKYPKSQKQLAELMGISSQQINKILKGNENLTLKPINKIEKTLSVR